MTSELRPAVDKIVFTLARHNCIRGLPISDAAYEAAAAVIEADREAVRAEQAAEVAKWRDKYNALGQRALEEVSNLGTKLGRTEADREAVRAEQAAELAKWKALAEALAGALEPFAVEWDKREFLAERHWSFYSGASKALTSYKEQRDA